MLLSREKWSGLKSNRQGARSAHAVRFSDTVRAPVPPVAVRGLHINYVDTVYLEDSAKRRRNYVVSTTFLDHHAGPPCSPLSVTPDPIADYDPDNECEHGALAGDGIKPTGCTCWL